MDQSSQNNQASLLVKFPSLSLTMYREIATHLCQVEGVETKLLPVFDTEFNYDDSQVNSLQIQLSNADFQGRQVEEILAYYQNIFGAAQILS